MVVPPSGAIRWNGFICIKISFLKIICRATIISAAPPVQYGAFDPYALGVGNAESSDDENQDVVG